MIVIPARGGSKRLSRKNLREVGGELLIVRAVKTAMEADRGRVVVSSDDWEIRAEASRAGAEVVLRPEGLSGDSAASEAAVKHVLETLGVEDGLVTLMQCTSPFTGVSDVRGVIDLVEKDSGLGSGFSVIPYCHCLWDSFGKPINHESLVSGRRMSQDKIGEQYQENGALYTFAVGEFLEGGGVNRFMEPIGFWIMDEWSSVEIDDARDLRAARALAGD